MAVSMAGHADLTAISPDGAHLLYHTISHSDKTVETPSYHGARIQHTPVQAVVVPCKYLRWCSTLRIVVR